MLERGTVVGLDRATSTAFVLLHGGSVVPAIWLGDAPPCPRSVAIVESTQGQGQRVLYGTEGPQRLVMHDDFWIPRQGADVGLIHTMSSDVFWYYLEGSSGTTTIVPSTLQGVGQANDRVGQVILTCGAGAAGQYVAITRGTADGICFPTGFTGCYWMTCTIALGTALTSMSHQIGIATFNYARGVAPVAGDRLLCIAADTNLSATNWVLYYGTGSSIAWVDTGYPMTVNEWVTFDVIVNPSAPWAAAFVNGAFACQSTSGLIPGPGSAGAPFVLAFPRAAGARSLHVDRITHWLVGNLRQPYPDNTVF